MALRELSSVRRGRVSQRHHVEGEAEKEWDLKAQTTEDRERIESAIGVSKRPKFPPERSSIRGWKERTLTSLKL